MAVSLDDVRHIAALARLSVSDDRATTLVAELNTILAHMEVLSSVPTPSALDENVTRSAPLRPDVGPPTPLAHPRESLTPRMRDGFFLVPRLATHEDSEVNDDSEAMESS
jgi:aspartyl-tRNA(Asn)/glutamyl-tRNA(Gln) amidotransferase subunit C